MTMELCKIEYDFTVCKIDGIEQIDFTREFVFLSKTDDEISLVCETAYVPGNSVATESGWNALKVSGILDFGLIGVIAKIASILAEAQISIFVVSTYNTDYILIKNENFDKSVELLMHNGYNVK